LANKRFVVSAMARPLACLLGILLACVATTQASAAVAIPEGSALWFACTEPVFKGPLSLRCRRPYDPRYLQTFLHGFARFTPENEFKMVYLEPLANRFNFTLADQVAAFARANNKTIRGHTLLWNQQTPWWLRHPLLPWNSKSLTNVMHTYIASVVGHFATAFPGVVSEWDVVNEPLSSSGTLGWSPWEAAIGSDYIRTALQFAHAADPAAKLLINEDGADSPGPKSEALLSLASSLKASGAPINAVGFEAHVTPDTAPGLGYLLWLWHRYAQAGLDVEVTELDVGNDNGIDDPAAKLAVFQRYAEACRLAGNCTGLTVWGVANAYSWLGATADALLYNLNFVPSPAVEILQRLLGATPVPATPATRPPSAHRHRRRHQPTAASRRRKRAAGHRRVRHRLVDTLRPRR
jgi:endo-1,4-beta-xylanase